MGRNLLFFVFVFIWSISSAQYTLSGIIVEKSGITVQGASVSIENTYLGTLTDKKGNFKINNVKPGDITLAVKYLDYTSEPKKIKLFSDINVGKIIIRKSVSELSDIKTFSGVEIPGNSIKNNVNLDFNSPYEISQINHFYSIPDKFPLYYSSEGGGISDFKLAYRGLDQNNIGIVINGISMNNSFSGDIDWNAWNSILNFSSSLQFEKGINSSRLSSRSIAGTLNYCLDDGSEAKGGFIGFLYGSGSNFSTQIKANSGLIKKRFSISLGSINNFGEGIIDKTWFNQNSFYLGSKFILNDKHSLNLYGLYSKQNHAQNLRQQNIATYSKGFATKIDDYSTSALDILKENESGILFNPDWNYVSTNYKSSIYRNGKIIERRFDDYVNIKENYSGNPFLNLFWTAKWSDLISQNTSIYYHNKTGGNSGTSGNLAMDFSKNPDGIVDLNKTISQNSQESKGILINDVDNYQKFGAISELNLNWNRNFITNIDINYSLSSNHRFEEVRDLLGGNFYIDNSSELRNDDYHSMLGDTISYNYKAGISSYGTSIHTKFKNDDIAINAMFGWVGNTYSFQDNFRKGTSTNNKDSLYYEKSTLLNNFQTSIAAKYVINDNISAYGNIGFTSRPALYQFIINSKHGVSASSPFNEYFFNYELGANYSTSDNKLITNLGFYVMSWNNIPNSIYAVNSDGSKDIKFVTGNDASFRGIELNIVYKPFKMLCLDLYSNISDNKYTKNVTGTVTTYETGTKLVIPTDYYLLNLKTGFNPANSVRLSAIYTPVNGLHMQLTGKFYSSQYSLYDVASRTKEELDENDKIIQSWKIPAYLIGDFAINYTLPLKSKLNVSIFGNINNIFNTEYIESATDNSTSVGYVIKDAKGNITNNHAPERAQVYFGMPRKFNLGIRFGF